MGQLDLPPEGIGIARADEVLTVTLDRMERRNAVTDAMWRWLGSKLHEAALDARLVILQGAGANFSAGADISEFETVRRDAATARAYETSNSAAFRAVRTLPCPTIASIAGVCFGGGFGLAAACDLRIAARSARFSIPAARLGLAYPADAIGDIAGALSPQMARYLLYTGTVIGAEEARQAGFLLSVVDDDALPLALGELAQRIGSAAPLSNRATKAALRAHASGNPGDLAEAEGLGAATFDSADYAEGRAAFRERRDPRFIGR